MPTNNYFARCSASRVSVCATAVLFALGATTALAGVPYPTRDTPAPVDAGLVDVQAANVPIAFTIALKLRDPDGAEQMLKHVSTPGDALFRKFLTTAQFQNRFGPTDASFVAVSAALAKFGLTSVRSGTTTLRVTGLPADIERAFQVSLHQFQVGATASAPAYSFRAPVQSETIPAELSPIVQGVFGLSSRPMMAPHNHHAAGALHPSKAALISPRTPAPPDAPGYWTVEDFDDYYDVKPLYRAGFDGTGQTIGIATLASFTQSDAYDYWFGVGLKVNQHRIRQILVHGGSGAPSDASGSIETTLDVEQSGGIAPGAEVLVYEAPNTNDGFVDMFGKIVDENVADAISCSWGSWEWYNTVAGGGGYRVPGGGIASLLAAVHAVFVQAGIQGQSLFTAAGDAGAYDANDGQAPPDYSLALSVDYPASDPANTAAGGTTLPATLVFTFPAVTITIPKERVWAWDYLLPLCGGYDPIECGIFPVGGGGGVSIEWPVPSYQMGLTGVQVSQPDQAFIDEDTVPPTTIYTLPAGYAGRNVPDISLNADPETGYTIGYTLEPGGSYSVYTEYGGTSFVGPQLNGVTQLIAQKAGSRLGFLNPALYGLAAEAGAYHGPTASFRYVPAGNNDFYYGTRSYNPAVGLGTLDVARLANVLGPQP